MPNKMKLQVLLEAAGLTKKELYDAWIFFHAETDTSHDKMKAAFLTAETYPKLSAVFYILGLAKLDDIFKEYADGQTMPG